MLRLSLRRFSQKAPPEPLLPAAINIWEARHEKPKALVPEEDDFFTHELYTPPAKPSTGMLKDLPKPLHYPKYDQSRHSIQKIGFSTLKTFDNQLFDHPTDSPIGDYPRLEQQWTVLKNPHEYWDKQGRRNYGEILHDFDNFTDIMGIGPMEDTTNAFRAWTVSGSFILVICGIVYFWDPEKHRFWAEKDYPFDGLRIQLGGNPSDSSDTFNSAPTYQI